MFFCYHTGMFKNFLIRKMIKSQLKGVPEAEQERIIKIVQENPALFQKIAAEVQAKMKAGKNQMAAVQEVMAAHKNELKDIL